MASTSRHHPIGGYISAAFVSYPQHTNQLEKTELDVSIHWIGWPSHFSAGYIDIPKDKCDKLLNYIQQLMRHSRTPRSYLEKVIGLIMWITQLFPFLCVFGSGTCTMTCIRSPAPIIAWILVFGHNFQTV